MNNYGLALNPLVGAAWGDETADTLKSEYVQKRKT